MHNMQIEKAVCILARSMHNMHNFGNQVCILY